MAQRLSTHHDRDGRRWLVSGWYVLRQSVGGLSWLWCWKIRIARNGGSAPSFLDLLRALSSRQSLLAWAYFRHEDLRRRFPLASCQRFQASNPWELGRETFAWRSSQKRWAEGVDTYTNVLRSASQFPGNRSSNWCYLRVYEGTDEINQDRTSKHWEDWTWMAKT